MTNQNKAMGFSLLMSVLAIFVSCSENNNKDEQPSVNNEAEILLQYLENNGNIVNLQAIPFFINADEIYQNIKATDYYVIDIRSEREYKRGRIENAVNVQAQNILDYFENRIEPNSFKKIAIVCNNSHESGYVVAILQMLGYNNTYNLRFGMSAWNDQIARRFWYANISDELKGRLETTPYTKAEPGKLPLIETGKTTGYEILRERAQKALEINWEDISIEYMDILEQTDDYYLINYWPQALYDQGHLPGAIQYNPKKSFHSTEDILTLPTDRPLVVYCYSGQNSVYASAFLAVMGYDFRSLDYGSNGFVHTIMKTTQPPGRSFSEIHVKNYPLVSDGMIMTNTSATPATEKVEVTTVQGGC
jgi:rhodanese-related sulfurtransferase